MKAKLLDRILLAILLIFVIALCVCVILIAARVIPLSQSRQILERVYNNDTFAISVGAGAVLTLIVALRLMFAGSGAKGEKKVSEPAPTSTLVKTSEFGSTFVALSALDAMVQKHCKANNHIRAVNSTVSAVNDGGVTISLRLSLMPDCCIPELTGELSRTLKEYVEGLSGIIVREIGILVEDTSTNPKARVD